MFTYVWTLGLDELSLGGKLKEQGRSTLVNRIRDIVAQVLFY